MSRMARRFNFRFSVRTLAIFLTLVCVYFGAWEATKKYGIPQTEPPFVSSGLKPYGFAGKVTIMHANSPIPFIVKQCEYDFYFVPHRSYYFWFFGAKTMLFQAEWDDDSE